MAGFTCPNCGHVTSIFGQDGATKIADEMDLDILGDVPLHLSIREMSDAGTPVVVSHSHSPQVQCLQPTICRISMSIFSILGVF